jgi:nicotinamidase-related amidase
MASKALVLVDVQNEWVDKDSEYYVGDLSELIEKTNALIKYCRRENYRIIFTKHIEPDSEDAFAPGSRNSELMDAVERQDSDVIVTKHKISPFYETDLDHHLEGVEELVVCGLLTNLCVRSLAHDAYDRDFSITIITDCCRAFDEETHTFTIKDLRATREEIGFVELEAFIR